MTITFILNGEDVETNADANQRLIDIIRDDFKLAGAKSGCLCGNCGSCTVIFNGSIVSACLIPAMRVRGSEIITIEGYELTDEYTDIIKGFNEANVRSCGYCNSAKILITETLLTQTLEPAQTDIITAFSGIKCRCTDLESLINGVIAAAIIRKRRKNNAGNI
ncbi:(2Fe-2S)-binding protein [Spirochaetia bacterium]|nr:(2Fe-2S)-binding protein [Spirochaetia bacterium]